MIILDQQYRNVLIFLVVVLLAGSGYWLLKHFHPTLFLGKPDLVVEADAETAPPSEGAKSAPKLQEPAPLPEIVVHVTGAVQSPGVYRLSPDARVQDAVEKAGGATPQADVHRLNLAAKVHDAQQIAVPEISQAKSLLTADGRQAAPPQLTVDPTPPLHSSIDVPPSTDGQLIDLNTATLEQLQTLPRIGPATAQRIIEYRETYGVFSTVDDLTNVKGIGEKTVEKIRHLVVVY